MAKAKETNADRVFAGADIGAQLTRQRVQRRAGAEELGQLRRLLAVEIAGQAQLALADAEQIGRYLGVVLGLALQLRAGIVQELLDGQQDVVDRRTILAHRLLP